MSRTHLEVVADLQSRWPEHQVARSQARVRALCDLLGNPEQSCPVILITGTNGKGSTAIMVEALLRAMGLRTGRFSSPHLVSLTERIVIDGEPISDERFDDVVDQLTPMVDLVDAQRIDDISMTFFEVMTALAYAAFADAPVDVAVVEVGMGGEWDATNIVDAAVAVVGPVALDHTALLGSTISEIAVEKAGIIKPGAKAVLAAQEPEAGSVLLARCVDVGAEVLREGVEFGLIDRRLAVGGQLLRLETAQGPLDDIFLPLYGEHMAHNAAVALAAVEAFLGGRALPADVVAEGFASVTAPARVELVRTSPSVLLDTCHNPHGAKATIDAVTEAFAFEPLIGVMAMMADKDVRGVCEVFSQAMSSVVCTTITGSPRALSAHDLAEQAADVFGPDRVRSAPDMASAIEEAVAIADQGGPGAGILVAGSVYAAGEARTLFAPSSAE